MSTGLARALSWIVLGGLLTACRATASSASRPASQTPHSAERPASTPGAQAALYSADEALRDALAAPLQYVGTGSWPGSSRMFACAFRNERVLVVNVYCGVKDTPALRVDIYSPARGRLRIYAEAKGSVIANMRQLYFTFTIESEPAGGAAVPPLSLLASFPELQIYEQRRYDAYLPTCFAGTELGRARSGCLGPLAAQASSWSAHNQPFLDRASSDWYRLVRELRQQATQHGRDPD